MLYLTGSSGFRATANFFRRGSFDSSTAAPAGVNSPEFLINRSLNRFRRVTALMSLPARTAFNAFLCPSVTLNRFVIPSLLPSLVPNRLSIFDAELLGIRAFLQPHLVKLNVGSARVEIPSQSFIGRESRLSVLTQLV